MTDIISDFAAEFARHGLDHPDAIVADGKLHRFRSGPEKSDNGFYRLSVQPAHTGGEIGFGLIGCWKRDVKEQWASRDPKTMARQDKAVIKQIRESFHSADAEAKASAAIKAKSIWDHSAPADPGHAYLARKQIDAFGIRCYKGSLVVPILKDGQLTSLQFINPDGSKRFLKDGVIEGGYTSIGGRKDAKLITIAEGYATAASIHMAVGIPVVVAFNAGNLLAVSSVIKAKYPEAKIIIAADNDQFTKIKDKMVNVGLIKAKAAARQVEGSIAVPHFAVNDPEKRSDWNDYHLLHGLDALALAFSGDRTNVPTAADVRENSASPREPAADWRQRLIPGKEVAEGHPFPFDGKSKTNAYMFLNYHERFAGLLCYNEFTDAVMLTRRAPWDTADTGPRPIRDDDFFMITAHLEYFDISVSKETAADAAIRVAKEHSINPPREYLERLIWDGQARLDNWLTYYLGADDQPEKYLALVGSKWLIGAVGRVYEPGSKFDSVLILEGAQGLGKSMALRALATMGGQDFFLDSVGDIRSKDTLMTMQGKLIVEIAELASFKKSENEEIKAFITRQVDEYRPPYGRVVVKRPRYFVLAGSTNEIEDGYLTDDTGNRRYWPVKCKSIDAESVERDAPQLWAEAVCRYKAGERNWLSREEIHYSNSEQKSRFVEDAWQERISKIIGGEWAISIDEVLNKLEMKPKDINNMVKKRVKNSLRQLGWHETRRAGEGRLWRLIDHASENNRNDYQNID